MQQVRVSRGKDKASSRKHGASPYAKMTTCGKKENKTSVTPEKQTNETKSAVGNSFLFFYFIGGVFRFIYLVQASIHLYLIVYLTFN